jgi:peptidoglycan/LPS O-acetylase OafA/YrhL
MDSLESQELGRLAIYAMSTVLTVAIVISGVAVTTALRKNSTDASESIKDFFNGGYALKILTVFAVLITATYLALAGRLSEGAIALLSSVSGYVLGTMQGSIRPDYSGEARKILSKEIQQKK